MRLGDKVTVIENPRNKTHDEVRQIRCARTERQGILESVSSNVIVIKYKNYRETFNIADMIENRIEIKDEYNNTLNLKEFKRMIQSEKRFV